MKLVRITQVPARDVIVQVDDETAEAAAADGWGNVLDGSYPYADSAPQEIFTMETLPASFTAFLSPPTELEPLPQEPEQSKGKAPSKASPAAPPATPATPATPAAETPAASDKGNKPDTNDKKPAKSEKE